VDQRRHDSSRHLLRATAGGNLCPLVVDWDQRPFSTLVTLLIFTLIVATMVVVTIALRGAGRRLLRRWNRVGEPSRTPSGHDQGPTPGATDNDLSPKEKLE
jgi:hypothetical protein